MLDRFCAVKKGARGAAHYGVRGVLAGLGAVTVLSLAACSASSLAEDGPDGEGREGLGTGASASITAGAVADGEASATPSSSAAPKPKEKGPVISVADGASDVSPFEPVTVTSDGIGLETVTMTNEVGYVVAEKLSEDGMTWSTNEVLGYNRTYHIEAVDEKGNEASSTFTTPAANGTVNAAMSPLPGSEVGVGQTVGIRFGSPIADRVAAQEAITVTTTPHVDGAFYWLNDYEVRWRPEEYWEPGTKVEVKADIEGVDLGGGIYGAENNQTNFTIGDRVIAIVDDNTKTMQVWKNHELLREIPVSLGRDVPDFATPRGQYIIGDEYDQLLMDSTTYGLAYDEGGYKINVDYATQMSYSGIYVHSAPWSVWAQGNTNTSHGCINVSPEAAQWFQSVVKRGDIVQVKNTTGPVLPVTDGLGDWNLSWDEWSAGNAEL